MSASVLPIEQIVTRLRPDAHIEQVRPIGHGGRRETVEVEFRSWPSIIIQSAGSLDAAETELALLTRLDRETSIPTAPPIRAGQVGTQAWIATDAIDGIDLHGRFTSATPRVQRRLIRQFGAVLGEVHALWESDHHGPVLAGGPGELYVGDPASWTTYFGAYTARHLSRLPAAFDDLRVELAEAMIAAPAAPGPARLFPWDLRPGNALCADDAITAIIDWEGPIATAPALALAKAEYVIARWYVGVDRGQRLVEALHAGYETVRPIPEIGAEHRIATAMAAAVDSHGAVTNPGYPPVDDTAAVAFHHDLLERFLAAV
jgi:hypothetical protein